MTILFIGFLALCNWIAFLAYIFVCTTQELRSESEAIEIMAAPSQDVISEDILSIPSVHENAVIPRDLIIKFAFDKSENISDTTAGAYLILDS